MQQNAIGSCYFQVSKQAFADISRIRCATVCVYVSVQCTKYIAHAHLHSFHHVSFYRYCFRCTSILRTLSIDPLLLLSLIVYSNNQSKGLSIHNTHWCFRYSCAFFSFVQHFLRHCCRFFRLYQILFADNNGRRPSQNNRSFPIGTNIVVTYSNIFSLLQMQFSCICIHLSTYYASIRYFSQPKANTVQL